MALQEAGYQYDQIWLSGFIQKDRQMKPVTSVVQMIKDQRRWMQLSVTMARSHFFNHWRIASDQCFNSRRLVDHRI